MKLGGVKGGNTDQFDQPAEAECDLHGMLVMGGPVKVLQRFHTFVSGARRRVAVAQDGLQQLLAFRIAPAQGGSRGSCNFSGVSSGIIGRRRLHGNLRTYLQDV